MNSNIVLYFPLGYALNTRAKTKVHRLTFVLFIIIPIFINCSFLLMKWWEDYLRFVLGFLSMYCIYEIGYIYNDVYTAKKENKPTIWLEKKHEEYVYMKFPLLVFSRLLWTSLFCVILCMLNTGNIVLFIACLFVLECIFTLHNFFRDIRNVFTDFGLNALKYCSILILFCDSLKEYIVISVYMIIEIPLLRSFEFGLTRKYYRCPIIESIKIDRFRVLYYFSLSVIGTLCVVIFDNKPILLWNSLYLLLFRTIAFLFSKNEKINSIRKTNSRK